MSVVADDLYDVYQQAQKLDKGESDKRRCYCVHGRVIAHRHMGKMIFVDIQNDFHKIQLQGCKQDFAPNKFVALTKISIGDLIYAEGYACKTKSGEPTLHIDEWQLIRECLIDFPDKHKGITKSASKVLNREFELITNQDSAKKLRERSYIMRDIRRTLEAWDYMEIETPILQRQYGGADAKPFVTHHNRFDEDMYLRIAPELFLKRAIVSGFENVYEIARCFRNEGVSHDHNPEFTMLEFYSSYADWRDAANTTESLIKRLVRNSSLSDEDDRALWSMNDEWDRIYLGESIEMATGIDIYGLGEMELSKAMAEQGMDVLVNKEMGWKYLVDDLFTYKVLPHLDKPTFVCEFPLEDSPLAKEDENGRAQRWELYIDNLELANGYTELDDPIEQRRRFEIQGAVDKDYIRALELGLPPCAGVGIGIDRLIKLMTNSLSIRECIFFPQLRAQNNQISYKE